LRERDGGLEQALPRLEDPSHEYEIVEQEHAAADDLALT
jgi:hypothetical protein